MPPTSEPLPMVAIYADESCLGNGREGENPGAAAGVIEFVHPATGRLSRWDYWISDPATTNNRMALRSIIEAFRVLSRKGSRFRVVFTSDSQYLVKGMREWVPGWMARGWRRKGGDIENLELWKQAVAAADGHMLDARWVRGHNGHPQNEYANFLATRAARDQNASDGAIASGFDDWIAAERARGKLDAAPDPFPDSASFRSLPPYPRASKPVG